MQNYHFVHLSNKTERLYQEFKQRLFASSHPLTKRIVIVPSSAMKSWLRLQMAEDPDLCISAGIEIGFVEPTINQLYQVLSDKTIRQSDSYEPSELELALALEVSLHDVASTYLSPINHCLPQEWLPLLQYLGVSKTDSEISKSACKRIRALASTLAKLFRDYGTFGGKVVADFKNDEPNWQILLWQQMEWIFSDWNYPAKKLDAFQIDPLIDPRDVQVHVFGLSFLSPLHHRFLCQVSLHLPVYYYLLSPCQKFWGDTLSNKETVRLKRYWDIQGANEESLVALEEYLRDCNPLLANFGRLGREMATQIESLDSQSTESYALPESIQIPCYSDLLSDETFLEPAKGSLTLLGAIQADLLLLRSIEKEKIPFQAYDGSIQIHAVPKRAREVQVIYDVLLSIIDKHRHDEDPIVPSDIFVMAPKIEEYAPFIRNVFESSESRLDIQLMDQQIPSQEEVVQGFLHLLSLSHGRWEASALLQLFEFTAFQKKHRLTAENVSTIKKWVKDAGIYWGKDHGHREDIFKRNYGTESAEDQKTIAGTWEDGLGRLLEGLAMLIPAEAHEAAYSPLNHIESSQSDLLGVVIHLVRSLQADLQPLVNGTKLSLEDWSIYLKCLFDAYFSSSDEEGGDGYRVLASHIESFGKASRKITGSTFAFETIYHHLQEGLAKETVIYKESNVQAVRFSSLLPMRAVPAKVVVLMGMGDGEFPGTDQANTLNLLLNNQNADYHPTRVDFDRYMFLESILSARQYFILSYVSQVPGTAKVQAPSLLVKELTSYLDHSYSVDNGNPSSYCFYNHPLVPFHQIYFSDDNRYKSYSQKHYQAAQSYYQMEKRERTPFIADFVPAASEQEETETVHLKDLLAFSKNPLKVYSNKVLGIYLDRDEDRLVKDEEDLFLSDLNASILTKQGLLGSKSAMLKKAARSGMLPEGPFKEVGAQKIEREIERYRKNFKILEINADEIFSIEFMEHYSEPVFCQNLWKLPPLLIGEIKIVGCIENVCSKGLVLFHKDEDKKSLENWPAYLVLQCLIEKYGLPIEPQMLFVKGDKAKAKKLQVNEQSLADYLEYYLAARKNPSPFVPDWIKHVLSGNTEDFQEEVKKDDPFHQEYDDYIKWFKRNSAEASLEPAIGHWQPKAQQLFKLLLTEGKKRKTVKAIDGGGE